MTAEKPLEYIEVRVDVPDDLADAVCNFITENFTSGLVLDEEEQNEIVGITFYIPAQERADYNKSLSDYIAQLLCDRMPAVPQILERVIRDTDWIERYKSSVKPIKIGTDILVRPQWQPSREEIRYDIIIEPKMAFGTGSHETTRSCLEAIRSNFQAGMRFLDLGTGSGILSILADKMGAKYIKAIDYDLAAVENCQENFEINHVSTPHDILFGSVEKCDRDEAYGFVCSNIIKSAILPILSRLLSLTTAGGFLVLSGLLEEDETEISDRLKEHDQSDYMMCRENRWLTCTLRKK